MLHRRTAARGILASALTAALVIAVVAANASAAIVGLEVVHASSASTSASPKAVTATCPVGKRVLSSGVDVTPGDGHVLVEDVLPTPAGDAVTARAVEDETGTVDQWYVAVSATCAPVLPGWQRVGATSASSSAGKAVSAACPAGKRVVGTGAAITGAAGQILLDGIEPNASLTRVRVTAKEDGTGASQSWTVSAYAICASAPVDGLQLVSAVSALNSDQPKVTEVSCPSGKRALGFGGTLDSSNGQLVLDALFPTAQQAGVGLATWEDDTGNATDWTQTVFAICAATAELRSAPTTGDVKTLQTVAQCAPDQFGTGSGAEITGGFGDVLLRHAYPTFWRSDDGVDLGAPATLATGSRYADPAGAWTLRAFAICGTPLPNAERVSAAGPETGFTGSATLGCPAGRRIVGSGFSTGPTQVVIVLLSTVPSADLLTTTVSVRRVSAGETEVVAHAVCADPPPGLQRVSAASDFDSVEVKVATARCPAGKRVLGTGARATGEVNGEIVIEDIRPDPTLTKVSVTGFEAGSAGGGTADDWGVTAYAICANR